jgi:curved DNA-binding protein CbpA
MARATQDYYRVLGVPRNATQEEIRKEFRKLALRFHPDRNRDKSPTEQQIAETTFKEINEAYGILGNPEKRRAYDQFGQTGTSNMYRYPNPSEYIQAVAKLYFEMLNFSIAVQKNDLKFSHDTAVKALRITIVLTVATLFWGFTDLLASGIGRWIFTGIFAFASSLFGFFFIKSAMTYSRIEKQIADLQNLKSSLRM